MAPRIICQYTENITKTINTRISKNNHVEIRFVPQKNIFFTSEMRIYGHKVTICAPNEGFGVVVENQDIANAMKETFENKNWNIMKELRPYLPEQNS